MQIQKSQSKIEGAGALSSFLNKFSNILDKFFDKLSKGEGKSGDGFIVSIVPDSVVEENENYELRDDKIYVTQENGDTIQLSPENYPYRCKVKFMEYEENDNPDSNVQYALFNFYLKSNETGKVLKDLGVKLPVKEGNTSIMKQSIVEHLDNILGKATNQDTDTCAAVNFVEASESLNVTLRKVTSATDTNIELVSVSSACNPIKAQAALEAVLDDDEFIEMIPEDSDITYEIDVDMNSYDEDEALDCTIDHTKMFNDILTKLYEISLTSRYVALIQPGQNSISPGWAADSQIEWFTRASKRYNAAILSPIALIKSSDSISAVADEQSLINDIVSILDLYWCNFDKYDQQTITGFIQNWRQDYEYQIYCLQGESL